VKENKEDIGRQIRRSEGKEDQNEVELVALDVGDVCLKIRRRRRRRAAERTEWK
jgi:hypothetical protein